MDKNLDTIIDFLNNQNLKELSSNLMHCVLF